MMPNDELNRAQQTILLLQNQLNTFRQSTYKAVHDDLGSTLSAASIKTKLLTDKISNEVDKHHLQEIHKLIKETLEQVTTLNKKLKSAWIPQATETFFESLEPELKELQERFNIQLKLEVNGRNQLKKQSLLSLTIMHEWVERYIQLAISRLVSTLTIQVTIAPNQIEWKFEDASALPVVEQDFKDLIEKTRSISGTATFQFNKNHQLTLTFPSKGDA